jgi:hypothetical protein
MAEWQTRQLEGLVGVLPWKFESSWPHSSVINLDIIRFITLFFYLHKSSDAQSDAVFVQNLILDN